MQISANIPSYSFTCLALFFFAPPFPSHHPIRDILKSTPIIAENDPDRTEWHLKCYPGGKRSEYSEYIGLYLHSETRDIDFYYGDVEFSIIDGEGQKRFCYEYKDYNIAGRDCVEADMIDQC